MLIKLPGEQVRSGQDTCAIIAMCTNDPVWALSEVMRWCRRGECEGERRAEAEVTTPPLVPL